MALDLARHMYAACAGEGDPVTSTVVVTHNPQMYEGMQCTVMDTLDMAWLDNLVADRIWERPQQSMLLILDDCLFREHLHNNNTITRLFHDARTACIHVMFTLQKARDVARRLRLLVDVIVFTSMRDARLLHQDLFPGVDPVALSDAEHSRPLYGSIVSVCGSGEAYTYMATNKGDEVEDDGGIAVPHDDAPGLPP